MYITLRTPRLQAIQASDTRNFITTRSARVQVQAPVVQDRRTHAGCHMTGGLYPVRLQHQLSEGTGVLVLIGQQKQ